MRLFFLLTTVFCQLFSASAQTGTLTGKVTDASTGQKLTGATVIINTTNRKTTSDLDGMFRFNNISAGTYTLQVTYVGYEIKEISGVEIKASAVTNFDINLSLSLKNNLEAVVVRTEARKESLSATLNVRRNSPVVSDIISAEQIKKSPDRNVGDVLKRVSGTSIQDNKFVVVRGMNDRYNEALLNGALLPSTEPDRKTFSFDMFPSDIVDNITVIKSALPEYPGSFAGGLIQVNMKEIPEKSFLILKGSLGFNSITTGEIFYNDGAGRNILGQDDGSRTIYSGYPSSEVYNGLPIGEKQRYARSLGNNWGVESQNAPVNNSYSLSGGFNYKSGNGGYPRFGGIFSISHIENFRFAANKVNSYIWDPTTPDSNATKAPASLYNDSVYSRTILNSGLANFSLKLSPNHKIFFNNLYTVNATSQTSLRTGLNAAVYDNLAPYKGYAHYFQSNRFYNTQLGGEHFIPKPKLRIRWLGYYTDYKRNEPNYRQMVYAARDENSPFEAYLATSTATSTLAGGVRFDWLTTDTDRGVNVDISKQFTMFDKLQTIKAGFAHHFDKRLRDGRYLAITRTNNENFNNSLLYLDIDNIFAPENFDGKTGFILNDINQPQWFYYDGSIRSTAGYIMLDNKLTEKIRLAWGARLEDYRNIVNSFNGNSIPTTVDSSFFNILPSGNLVYSVLPKANLRFSFSQTVVRPQYREMSAGLFYDFFQNTTFFGSPLTQTSIDNYEIRWEHFLPNSQYYSVSVYYKKFRDAIEQALTLSGTLTRSATWYNVPEASNYGVEAEFRKNFDFLGEAFKNLYFYTNASLIRSRVDTRNIGLGLDSVARPLQGQSPFIVNMSLQYSSQSSGLNISLLYNQVGDRIVFVGGIQDATIWERPHALLDFKVSKTFMKNGLVELTLGDILNADDTWFWDLNDNKTFNKQSDPTIQSQSFGLNASLSLSYRF
jgi:outer membrane receptor protein involved in Fe transport